jgi:Cdc6-like AAA superfamily ATPase
VVGIDIQSVRDKLKVIKYITKSDEEPLLHNVSVSIRHFSFRLLDFIRRNRIFHGHSDFVRQHINYINVIERAHASYWNDYELNHSVVRVYDVPSHIDWVDRVKSCIKEGRHFFLYGTTGYGKSTVVRQCLREVFDSSLICYLPCGLSCFEFSNVYGYTKAVVAGDVSFGYLKEHRSIYLQLADESTITINPKYDRLRSFVYTGIVIIISNYNVFSVEADSALERRFEVIQATSCSIPT